ncbi:MAG: HAMP domain-containing sensor histidine kinase [Acidobacteria bacterium]|nr:HAMP domain-containing sensor histidine kinase [Acidobacteriota bacterium]
MRVQPVTGEHPDRPADVARRVGSVVAEMPLPVTRPNQGISSREMIWQTTLVPVALRARYEGAGEDRNAGVFVLTDAAGKPLLEGRVRREDVEAARAHVRRRTAAAVMAVGALFCAWIAIPLMEWRRAARKLPSALVRMACVAAVVILARVLAWLAVGYGDLLPAIDTLVQAGPAWRLLLRSPIDFLCSAGAALALVALLGDGLSRLRTSLRSVRRPATASGARAVAYVLVQVGAGLAAGAALSLYVAAGPRLTDLGAVEWLRFSLAPWETSRLATTVGLVCWHAAAVWAAVVLLRFAVVWFRVPATHAAYVTLVACWGAPAILWMWLPRSGAGSGIVVWELAPPVALAVLLASALTRLARWRRHSSQALSYVTLFLALALPAMSMYPAAYSQAVRAKQLYIETHLAPQATEQRSDVQTRVAHSLEQVDGVVGLTDVVQAAAPPSSGSVSTDAAFLVWSQTDLAAHRLTSAIELYGEDGRLVSRFALNLPEYTSTQQRWRETSCDWDLFEEVSPFGSEERRLLHAGRGLCTVTKGQRTMVGSIVIHAMLDYGSLPFITSQNPYVELFRNPTASIETASPVRDVEFAVYGWSLRPIYASGSAPWTIDAETFSHVYRTRAPFWTRQSAGGRTYDVYLANDRGGIYVLGHPVVSAVGHLITLAELVTLVGVVFVALVVLLGLGKMTTGVRGERGRDLLRELRASFYKKLFLAFVAAAVIPVLILAGVAQAYITARLHADAEEAALRTTTVAQRVVEDYGRIQERGEGTAAPLNDDILVWISRVIGQDVNVFDGARVLATSERDLFASGLLPARTSADVYRAIVLDRRASFVGEERAGQFRYTVAAAPVRGAGLNTLLTVPLTMRQRAIELEIEDLNRRILLAVLAFVLLGSALGYWMAEKIADPVKRLQRATEQMRAGDLDARVPISSSDELRRLLETFNLMAADLKRQQHELERTHRLEAWADMARQVAHEIKNPLTPIQLSAEHLRRVHADRGTPLSPVLEECVESILSQVRLLRQIAAEFSSFASSPSPRPVWTSPAELVAEIVEPYRAGLPARVSLQVDVPADLPALEIDRSLIGRAITNMIENALHAMPGGGRLTVSARRSPDGHAVQLRVSDTGVGMDRAAIERIFEPYFSTKAVGTGLGLTIAKRNVDLHHGTIDVDSTPGHGTTVTVSLPITGDAA